MDCENIPNIEVYRSNWSGKRTVQAKIFLTIPIFIRKHFIFLFELGIKK